MDWTKAPGDTVVCESCNITLKDIVRSIALEDAETVEDVLAITGAVTGSCEDGSYKVCNGTIQEILDIYVPVYSTLKNGCGGGCGGCTGCG